MASPAFFYVKSKYNGMVLDISGQSDSECANVHLWNKLDQQNQQWYEDFYSGTIRSRMNNKCLSIDMQGLLIMESVYPGKPTQMWELGGGTIRHRSNKSYCLEVQGASTAKGARVAQGPFTGMTHQLWEFEYTQTPKNYHFIKSKLSGLYLDINGQGMADGTKVHMWQKTGGTNQIWYADTGTGTIRSKMNDKCLTLNSSSKLVMQSYSGSSNQLLEFAGNTIRSKHNNSMVLDIEGESRRQGASIILYPFKNSQNQLWEFEYTC